MWRRRRGKPVPSVPDTTIVSTAHELTDARLRRWVNVLRGAGLTVRVQAVGSPTSALDGVATTAWPRVTGARRLLRAMWAAWRADGRALVLLDPELAAAAVLLPSTRKRVLVADVHEDYLSVVEDRAWAHGRRQAAIRLVVRLATWAAARADVTVVADDHVPPHHARRRIVARNLPTTRRVRPPRRPAEPPRAVYIGDVRASRGLTAMVDAILTAEPWELDLIGAIADSDAAWVRQQVTDAGAEHRVRLHGRLPPEEAWDYADGAWAGFAMLENTPAFRAAVPTKVYEYLAHGLPVIATPLPRVQGLLHDAEAGVTVRDAEQAAAVLRTWYDEPGALQSRQDAALRWARQHLPSSDPLNVAADMVRRLLSEAPGGNRGTSTEPDEG